jgi:hypothetical protein
LPQSKAPECKLTDAIAEGIGKVQSSISEQICDMFDRMECDESVAYIGRCFHIDEFFVYPVSMQSELMRYFCAFIKEA